MTVLFYLTSFVILLSAIMVIFSRHPVHAVLWLILTFLSSAVIFVSLGAEFLAMLLIVVYVGAVAVLFLFVVMMLDVDFVALRQGLMKHLWLGLLVAIVFAAELVLMSLTPPSPATEAAFPLIGKNNTYELGIALFEGFPFAFLGAGMVLFVAMIGAIVLTIEHRKDVKRQNILSQIYRDPKKSLQLKDVKPGEGL